MKNLQRQIVTVSAYIQNKNGELLIIQRAQHDSHPGLWEIPSGGLEWGEDPYLGVLREVKEETNLDVEIEELLLVDSFVTERPENNHHFIRIGFACRMLDEIKEVSLSDDHQAYKWVSLDSVNELSTSQFFDRFIQKLKTRPRKIETT